MDRQSTNNKLIIVRGGGDLASGTVHRLASAGFPVLILETASPAAIRRQVSFCEAVYEGHMTLEGKSCVLIHDVSEVAPTLEKGLIPLLIDPDAESIKTLSPDIVIDAIIAKKNLGTHIDMAPLTIALGPGFCAGVDVDAVIETSRGHNLGRIITEGMAKPNTGIPGNIGGFTSERVIHATCAGVLRNIRKIGDVVEKDEPIAVIESTQGEVQVNATISGILRGLIRDGYTVTEHFKIADIDPRLSELTNCFTISDKSRFIAGSVLELVTSYYNKSQNNLC